MSWQPQMSMLCFSRAHIAATSWRPAKIACASVQSCGMGLLVFALLTTASGCPVFGGRGSDTTMVRHSAIRSFHPSSSHRPACPLLGLSPLSSSSVLLLLDGWGRGRAWGSTWWDLLSPQHLASQCICITHFLCTGLKNLLSGKTSPQAQSQDAARNISLFFLHSVKKKLSTFVSPEGCMH